MPPMPPIPPGMMPPGMYPPPPPAPPRPGRAHSFVRGIFVTLATMIFGLSLMLNIYLLFLSGALSRGTSSKTEALVDGDALQKIATVKLDGVIMDSAYTKFDRLLKQVEKDKNVKAMIVEIDSPGGSVTASDMIYDRLVRFRKAHPGVPVVAAMGSLAASGGYYTACGTDYIIAQRTTMTGNIGVLMPRYNVSDLAKKLGVSENTVTSSGTPFKNAGSMFKPDNPAETEYFQELIDEAFTQFKQVVKEGRGERLKQPLDEIANGKIYMAGDALKLGLIDQVGYLEDAISYAASTAGLSKPMVVRYEDNPSISELLFGAEGEGKFGGGRPGVTLHVSREVIDEITTPRLMYLWRDQ